MDYSIYVDQLVLEHWKGKIDYTDVVILSWIKDLDPKNPEIVKHMWRGHFLITSKWMFEQLPLLCMSQQAVSKRIRKLVDIGILSCMVKTVDGNKRLNHYRLSALYWKIHNKRHDDATKAAQKDDKKPTTTVVGSPKTDDKKPTTTVSEANNYSCAINPPRINTYTAPATEKLFDEFSDAIDTECRATESDKTDVLSKHPSRISNPEKLRAELTEPAEAGNYFNTMFDGFKEKAKPGSKEWLLSCERDRQQVPA